MKKLFLWMLFYWWAIGVGLQMAWYLFTGEFIHGYYDVCPDQYYLEAAGLLTGIIGVSMFLICLCPFGYGRLGSVFKKEFGWYYYAVVLYLILSRLIIMGLPNSALFNKVLSGVYNGTLYAYLGIFLSLNTIFLIVLVCMKQKVNIWLSCGLYVLYSLLCHSRQGMLYVFVILTCIFVSTKKAKEYGNDIKYMILAVVILAPAGYVLATAARGYLSSSWKQIPEAIVSRCSRLELAAIPLYERDQGIYDKILFSEKYSFVRQIQLIINSFVPGDIFPGDVQPNQYYRSIFGGVPERVAKESYYSINMTLPSYLTLKYGMFAAVIVSVLVIVGLYFVSHALQNYLLSRVIPILVMMDVLDYFDWVYITACLFSTLCTIGVFWMVRQVFRKRFRLQIGYWKKRRIKRWVET